MRCSGGEVVDVGGEIGVVSKQVWVVGDEGLRGLSRLDEVTERWYPNHRDFSKRDFSKAQRDPMYRRLQHEVILNEKHD